MLLTVTIILSVCLISSLIVNILLYKAGVRKVEEIEVLETNVKTLDDWLSELKMEILKTYAHIKLLDDKQMFEKDDDVGVVFKNMVNLIDKMNKMAQGEEVEEGE